jgi:2-keto-4-pentenoate hydratase
MIQDSVKLKSQDVSTIATAFAKARQARTALVDYPGTIPETLNEAYQIQDLAISLRSEPIIGWKIGRLSAEGFARHGSERLCGPIFQSLVRFDAGNIHDVWVHDGGFAAVEAEFLIKIKADTDPLKHHYEPDEALYFVESIHAGIEMAGSPLKTINALGPTVVVSDFGNNNGVIIAQSLWDSHSDKVPFDSVLLDNLRVKTWIDETIVGEGGLSHMPSGVLKAVAWLAGHLAQRSYPLKQGQWISSGAMTGIHEVGPGQSAHIEFTNAQTHVPIRLRTNL